MLVDLPPPTVRAAARGEHFRMTVDGRHLASRADAAQLLSAQNRSTTGVADGTGDWVIEAFIDAWKPALGSSPAIRYRRDTRRWHEAADRPLERLEPDRTAAGFTQMVGDPYIGGGRPGSSVLPPWPF